MTTTGNKFQLPIPEDTDDNWGNKLNKAFSDFDFKFSNSNVELDINAVSISNIPVEFTNLRHNQIIRYKNHRFFNSVFGGNENYYWVLDHSENPNYINATIEGYLEDNFGFLLVLVHMANTGTVQMKINNLNYKEVKKQDGTSLEAGNLKDDAYAIMMYNSITNCYNLISPVHNNDYDWARYFINGLNIYPKHYWFKIKGILPNGADSPFSTISDVIIV